MQVLDGDFVRKGKVEQVFDEVWRLDFAHGGEEELADVVGGRLVEQLLDVLVCVLAAFSYGLGEDEGAQVGVDGFLVAGEVSFVAFFGLGAVSRSKVNGLF